MAIRRKQEKKSEETLLDLNQARLQANNFFEKNQKAVIGIVAGLVVIIGGWFVYKNLIQQPKEEKAISQMWMAQFQF